MRKSPTKRRARNLYKIWESRREILKIESRARDRGDAPTKRVEFSYSAEERAAITKELSSGSANSAAFLDESLDEIELTVRLTLHARAHQRERPISDDLMRRYRALDGPIAEILSVVDAPEFRHLEDTLPNLRMELNMLSRMVSADQRKGAGRPPDPINKLHIDLIERLADVWARHHEAWPAWHYQDGKGRDWGPVYRFLGSCLTPARIKISDYIIRKAIKRRA